MKLQIYIFKLLNRNENQCFQSIIMKILLLNKLRYSHKSHFPKAFTDMKRVKSPIPPTKAFTLKQPFLIQQLEKMRPFLTEVLPHKIS